MTAMQMVSQLGSKSLTLIYQGSSSDGFTCQHCRGDVVVGCCLGFSAGLSCCRAGTTPCASSARKNLAVVVCDCGA